MGVEGAVRATQLMNHVGPHQNPDLDTTALSHEFFRA